jgi:flagellar hook-associated protein 1 FlgK
VPLTSQRGSSITELYDAIVSQTTQASAVSQAVTKGFRVFHRTLEGQQLAVSGVSIDEEAVKIITYQRIF